MATVQRERVSRDELRRELDRLADESLGISADEFMERYVASGIDLTEPRYWRAIIVARLLLDEPNGSAGKGKRSANGSRFS